MCIWFSKSCAINNTRSRVSKATGGGCITLYESKYLPVPPSQYNPR